MSISIEKLPDRMDETSIPKTGEQWNKYARGWNDCLAEIQRLQKLQGSDWKCFDGQTCPSQFQCMEFDFCGRGPQK